MWGAPTPARHVRAGLEPAPAVQQEATGMDVGEGLAPSRNPGDRKGRPYRVDRTPLHFCEAR